MRRFLALVAVLAASLVWADEQRTNVIAVRLNLGSAGGVGSPAPTVGTTYYCRSNGQGGSPTGAPISVVGRVVNVASSTTVTSVGSAGSFTGMGVGDVLFINRGGTIDTAVILTWTNANSVVVDAAQDWSNSTNGYPATYRKTVCGSTANDGWVDVSGATRITFNVEYNQGDLGAMSMDVECRTSSPDANPVRVFPSATSSCGSGTLASNFCDFATAGINSRFTVVAYEPWNSCRIGLVPKTSDASDAAANLDRVNASIVAAYAW